jgi:uncharacterized protein (TIGR02300 family)
MSTKTARGTKRTCQNNECGARFYDLARDPILCPICSSTYVIASSPLGAAAIFAEEKASRSKAKKPEFVAEKEPAAEGLPEAEGDEVLVDIEEAEDVPAEADETFLEEEEEEGGDLSNVIGGPVAEGEEEP